MKQFTSGMLFALLIAALYACTTPAGGGTGSGGGLLFKVNGRAVTAEEFFEMPQARETAQ